MVISLIFDLISASAVPKTPALHYLNKLPAVLQTSTYQLCVLLNTLNKTILAPASVERLHLSGARLLLLLLCYTTNYYYYYYCIPTITTCLHKHHKGTQAILLDQKESSLLNIRRRASGRQLIVNNGREVRVNNGRKLGGNNGRKFRTVGS